MVGQVLGQWRIYSVSVHSVVSNVSRNLHNRVIVITGASSGIGAATAVACAHAGMDVVLAARRESRLIQVADQIRQIGRRSLPVVCDVDRTDDVNRLVQRTVDEFGRLDVMFANAGFGIVANVLDTTDSMIRAIFETNFYGTLRCVHAAVPVMRQSPVTLDGGHILICSSCVSEISLPMYSAYCATKAAQDAIAQSLRAELADQKIDVTSVHPVTTRTEFFERAIEKSPGGQRRTGPHNIFVQSPQRVAKLVVRGLRRPCPEIWPSLSVRFALAVCTAFPRLTSPFMNMAARRMTPHNEKPPEVG